MRVTTNTVINRAMRNINTAYKRYADKQVQVGSGKAIQRLSDDPHNAAKAVRLRSAMRSMEQYARNADSAFTMANMYDDNLNRVGGMLLRIRELVGRAANDPITPSDREAISVEVGQLFEELMQSANAAHLGAYMYAGHKGSGQPPFVAVGDPPASVEYRGDSGKSLVEVGPGLTITTNVTGDQVFQSPGGPDLFATVLEIRAHLDANDVQSLSKNDLDAIDACLNQVLKVRSEMGARANRLELVENRLSSDSVSLESLLSDTEDIDIAKAMMEYANQEIVYNAALAAAARTVQIGLLQYLK